MAHFLVEFGEVEASGGADLVEDRVWRNRARVRFHFRGGRTPYGGGWYGADDLSVAWVGRPRLANLASMASPGEQIVRRWRAGGESCVEEFNGVLAFALFDARRGRLYGFRDKLGLVPMVYAKRTDAVCLSTDAGWLCEVSQQPRRPDIERLRAFLTAASDAKSNDYIRGVSRVLPGQRALWGPDRDLALERYWRLPTEYLPEDADFGALVATRLEEAVDAAPPRRMLSLSGGVDSSALAAFEAQLRDHEPVEAATMVAPSFPRLDESEYVAKTAERLSAKVHHFNIESYWPLADPAYYGDNLATGPQFHPGEYYGQYFQQWLRTEFGCRAIVFGDGAELILRGRPYRIIQKLAEAGRLAELARFARLWGWRWVGRIAVSHLMDVGMGDTARRLKGFVRRFSTDDAGPSWLRPDDWVDPEGSFEGSVEESGPNWPDHPHPAVQSVATWDWERIARTLLRRSEASGQIQILPYLDDRLWEVALRIPPEVHMADGRRKYALREAVRGLLPEEIVDAEKRGFFDQLVQHGLAYRERGRIASLFEDSHLAELGLIDPTAFVAAFDDYCEEVARVENATWVGSFPVWRTIAAELWLRNLA